MDALTSIADRDVVIPKMDFRSFCAIQNDLTGFTPLPRLQKELIKKVISIHAKIMTFLSSCKNPDKNLSPVKRLAWECLFPVATLATVIVYLVFGILGVVPVGLTIAIDEVVKANIDKKARERWLQQQAAFSKDIQAFQEPRATRERSICDGLAGVVQWVVAGVERSRDLRESLEIQEASTTRKLDERHGQQIEAIQKCI